MEYSPMSTYNPRILAVALEDLHDEMDRWSETASETLAMAERSHREGVEEVDRVLHQAAITMHEAQVDAESVQDALSTVASAVDRCMAARQTAQETGAQVTVALDLSRSTLLNWQNELRLALEWLERAKARLALAVQMLQQAIYAFEQAKAELERTDHAYQVAVSEKRNATFQALALRAAQANLEKAAVQVQLARQEVEAAQLEVAQAEARVACCQRAVGFSEQAVNLAEQAMSEANEAINAAERSHEMALAADRSVHQAEQYAQMEMEVAGEMQAAGRSAQTYVEEAFAHFKQADHMEESSQRYSKNARMELRHRTGSLYEMNRPTLV
jgi:tetratricopeptide (TPR) repeat protein